MDLPVGMELRKFVAPEFVFGAGARHLAGRYAKNFGVRRVLVVTDPGVRAAGWTAEVIKDLESEGLWYSVYDQVTPNPRDFEVMKGAEVYLKERCEAIVAVGGGSPMDCAKGIGIVSAAGGHILDYEGVDQVTVPIPPLICIPTTAGTSADVSQFAIIRVPGRKVKIALVSKTVVPDVALIDPVTTTTMDAHLTACTGLDALTHAVEAYVSNASSPVTDLLALEAIRLISANILPVIEALDDLELRERLMLGSLDAGLAFSNAILGAVHAMAHSLGGLLDLPHGECNAILLPRVVDFNFPSAPDRYLKVAQAMNLALEDLDQDRQRRTLVQTLESLRRMAGVTRTLADIGVTRADLARLARNAVQDPCLATNPRAAGPEEIEALYESAL
ncbi:MAG: alcohol dehydrogenase-like regulatory protein ErcA [Thermodesulfobacteriota bacterium]